MHDCILENPRGRSPLWPTEEKVDGKCGRVDVPPHGYLTYSRPQKTNLTGISVSSSPISPKRQNTINGIMMMIIRQQAKLVV
ncbi:hypothetical protein DPMN_101088 [Dreissena polymorpha]|uniref:Uncharacterized protein n=1 Tax=Dreissena polymorpha TaxID=45954 RepID=A0A9D4R806_DREPO|nr:hypothetical protein DPMN_101088 [Dreissena polymorpha]